MNDWKLPPNGRLIGKTVTVTKTAKSKINSTISCKICDIWKELINRSSDTERVGWRVAPFDRQSKTTYKRVVCFPPTPSELGEICIFWFSGPTESCQFTHQLGEHQRLSPVFWFSGWQTSVRAVQIFSDSGGRYLTGRVGWEMKQISENIAIWSY